jgi:hypothetical protein
VTDKRVRTIRASAAVLAVALALGAAPGCGDDEEEEPERTAAPPATETEGTAEATAETEAATETAPEEETEARSPEDQPGGAGDEVPARSQALFTARGGRIGPPLVRVPAFIAIRVELRSADGRAYSLRIGGRTLRVDGDVDSVSAEFDGLRPGRTLTGVASGGGRVRVEASAEPGP